jgi:hypothetical protein
MEGIQYNPPLDEHVANSDDKDALAKFIVPNEYFEEETALVPTESLFLNECVQELIPVEEEMDYIISEEPKGYIAVQQQLQQQSTTTTVMTTTTTTTTVALTAAVKTLPSTKSIQQKDYFSMLEKKALLDAVKKVLDDHKVGEGRAWHIPYYFWPKIMNNIQWPQGSKPRHVSACRVQWRSIRRSIVKNNDSEITRYIKQLKLLNLAYYVPTRAISKSTQERLASLSSSSSSPCSPTNLEKEPLEQESSLEQASELTQSVQQASELEQLVEQASELEQPVQQATEEKEGETTTMTEAECQLMIENSAKICRALNVTELPKFFLWNEDTAITPDNVDEFMDFLSFDRKLLDTLRQEFNVKVKNVLNNKQRLTPEQYFEIMLERSFVYPIEPLRHNEQYNAIPDWMKLKDKFSMDEVWTPQLGDQMTFFFKPYFEFIATYHPEWKSWALEQIASCLPECVSCTVDSIEAYPNADTPHYKLVLKYHHEERFGDMKLEIYYVPPHETAEYIVPTILYQFGMSIKWYVGQHIRVWLSTDATSEGEWCYGQIAHGKDYSDLGNGWESLLIEWDAPGEPLTLLSPWEVEVVDQKTRQPIPTPSYFTLNVIDRTELNHELICYLLANFCRGWTQQILDVLVAWAHGGIRSWTELVRLIHSIQTILPKEKEPAPHLVEFKRLFNEGIEKMHNSMTVLDQYTHQVLLHDLIAKGYKHTPKNQFDQLVTDEVLCIVRQYHPQYQTPKYARRLISLSTPLSPK